MDTNESKAPMAASAEPSGPSPPGSVKHAHRTPAATYTGRTTIRQRVGTYGFAVMIAGIPVQIAAMGFLGYLWSQQRYGAHDANDPNQRVWRSIVLNSWMAPTITLCTVIIQFIVGAQLVICTALAAGLILETSSTPFEDAPKLSLLRATNGGPLDIVMLMLKRFPHSFGLSVSHLLVVVLYLVGVALQFSSTLLVSDLGDITILSDPEVRRVAVADSEGAFIGTNGQFMFSKTPGVWSTFAESRNGTGTVSQNVTDTGIITRAFPPFESRERLLLRSYSGLAVTQQARTICVPAELNVQRTTLTYAASDQLMVQGAVSMSLEPFTAAGFRTEKYNYTNGVPVVVDRPTRMIDIPFACPFYNIQGGGRGVKGDDLAMALCFIQSGFFEPFLLVNAVGPFADWNSYATSGFQPVSTENSWATYKPTGPNSTSESFQPKDGLRLSASVCSTAWNNSILSVNASTSAPTQEYPLQWENSTQSWNTPEILRLLGVVGDPSDVGARGILRLDSYGPANDKTIVSILSTGPSDQVSTELYKAFTAALEGQEVDPLTNKDLAGFNRSLIFCSRCYPSTQINNDLAHPSSVLLMGAALNATNNPAAALDGLWTTWTQTAYTSAVGQLDQAGVADSTMMWAVTVTTPVRWHGFIATTVLLVFHIAVAVAIMVLFVGRTAYSFQGNFWPAMAQATGGEQVREFLDDVATTPDSEVDKIIKVRGLDGVSVCTGVDEGTGRVGLIRTKAL